MFLTKKSLLKYAFSQPEFEKKALAFALNHPDFKKKAIEYAFSQQGKPKSFNGLTQVFIDSEGRKYFKHEDDVMLPFQRLSALKVCMSELNSRISAGELTEFLDAMEKGLMSLASTKKGEVAGASKIGWLISEIKWRRDNLIHEDLLFKLASIIYIREDEDPAIIDSAIEEQKITQFKKDSAGREGGTWAFFFRAPLKEYIPFTITSEDDWTEYLKTSEMRMKAEKKMMESFRTAPVSSGT